MFIIPSRIRKPAETDVPIIAPILLYAPNLELMAEAVAATTTEVMMTILMKEDEIREPCQLKGRILQHGTGRRDRRGMTKREESSNSDRTLA